jgi:polyisoprenyl-phosphate glycosyltransferase
MQQFLTPDDDGIAYSLVIPVYGNESNIAPLLDALSVLVADLGPRFEVVFVVDGSPDRSYALLRDALPSAPHRSQLVALSRNFGAFPAIRTGLGLARGRYIAVMSADMQEPPELVLEFFRQLERGEYDVAFGVRVAREDPWPTAMMSRMFWWFYRRMVMRDVPQGGVDIFALRDGFRDELLRLEESNSSLLAQLFWLGGRRLMVDYRRRKREHGKSAWTLSKKFRYLSDSVFSFTDLPIKAMLALGAIGLACAALLGGVTLFAKISGVIPVPGYAGMILAILFFGALNMFGIGIIGTYAWRAYENTKRRPLSLIQSRITF